MTKPKATWPRGIGILEADDTACTTSGSGTTVRRRAAPLDKFPPSLEEMIVPAEAWAHEVLHDAGIVADGVVNGTDDTPENYAQRIISYARAIREKEKRGDISSAIADGIVLGGFVRESQLKFRWEKSTLKGEKFPSGKPKGSLADSTKHIHQLAADNRGASAKGLLQLADASIIGDMGKRTFDNHVSDARKIYPKQKKPRK